MNAQKYFEQHAEELIASYAGKNVVLFFVVLYRPMSAGWHIAKMRFCRQARF